MGGERAGRGGGGGGGGAAKKTNSDKLIGAFDVKHILVR